MAERDFERITSKDGGKVKYRVKSFDGAEKTLSVIREITRVRKMKNKIMFECNTLSTTKKLPY
jgi:hypothetical protein